MQALESVDFVCGHPVPLVDRVRRGDSAGAEELHRLLSRGVRFLVARKLPASRVDGCVREVFDRVACGIQRGDLANPERLVQFIRMHLTTCIREIQDRQMPGQHARNTASPPCAVDQRREVMQALLRGLSPSERESLIRFYVDGHDAQRICRELRTPEAEFRVLRVRVKSRFHELCVQGATGTAV